MARRSSKEKETQSGFSLAISLDGVPFLTLTENTIAGQSVSPERLKAAQDALEALSTFLKCTEQGAENKAVRDMSAEPLMAIPEWLSAQTYCVEYNPNCPSPFLVRLIAKDKGRLYGDEKDAVGYGKTLAEAAAAARPKARVFEP